MDKYEIEVIENKIKHLYGCIQDLRDEWDRKDDKLEKAIAEYVYKIESLKDRLEDEDELDSEEGEEE